MGNIQLKLSDKGEGHFMYKEGDKKLGEMLVNISGKMLTVFHTEVITEAEGKGLAKKLLNEMVDYSRKNDLKVIVLCPYVLAQFKRNPEQYADIWQNKNYG
ncbi:MAG TPA: GNAT family N-acetyltransferase [Hanamia sp.]|nr:GNAT family N-acetyltransferase [Hanamia sp.]